MQENLIKFAYIKKKYYLCSQIMRNMKKSLFRSVFVFLCAMTVCVSVYAGDQDNNGERPSLSQRYFNHSGKSSLTILELGYTYDFVDKMHIVEAGILDFRYKYWGMSLLNFEMGIVPKEDNKIGVTPWVGYKPSMHFYIPILKWLAISPYLGASVDCSYIGTYLIQNYEWNKEEKFFVDLYGGLGFYLTGVPAIPLEIRAEYRYPVVQNTMNAMSQGFYVSGRLHFTKAFK